MRDRGSSIPSEEIYTYSYIASIDYRYPRPETDMGMYQLAETYRQRGISVSTPGVGFDAELMQTLAEEGGGGSRFISDREETEKTFDTEFERMAVETVEQYLSCLEDLTDRIKRMEQRIAEAAKQEEYREKVQKLRAFRGIDYLTALALVCGIGDFRRFPGAGAFMSYPAPGTPRGYAP